jgi:hypothetical protein
LRAPNVEQREDQPEEKGDTECCAERAILKAHDSAGYARSDWCRVGFRIDTSYTLATA